MDWLQILSTLGFFLLIFAGFFVVISFVGGFAGAIAAGGREDRSLLYNFGIGFAGWLAASLVWTAVTGAWPEAVSAGMIASTFVASIIVALFADWRERHRARSRAADSPSAGVSAWTPRLRGSEVGVTHLDRDPPEFCGRQWSVDLAEKADW